MTTNHSSTLGQLAAALAAFKDELGPIPKGTKGQIGQKEYWYASFGDIQEKCDPLLKKHGLAITQCGAVIDELPAIRTILMHESGEWTQGDILIAHIEQKGINAAQAQGSAITYARRYGYCAALCIVAEDDDDGAAAGPARRGKGEQAPEFDVNEWVPTFRQWHEAVGNVVYAKALAEFHVRTDTDISNRPTAEKFCLRLKELHEVGSKGESEPDPISAPAQSAEQEQMNTATAPSQTDSDSHPEGWFDYLKECRARKARLGEESYYTILAEEFGIAKSNQALPAQMKPILMRLQQACEDARR